MLIAHAMIIGGTGIGDRLSSRGGEAFSVPTEFGCLRGKLLEHKGKVIALVARHALGHRTPPHAVPYRAMALGARRLGCSAVLASAAVGSLRPEWAPKTFVVVSDLVEASGRRQTLFEQSVEHTPCDHLADVEVQSVLMEECKAIGAHPVGPAVYWCADGPRYESPAEIQLMKRLGADVVGMTAGTEAVAMREAGVPYGCLAVVTNLAAGLAPLDGGHQEVVDVMKSVGARVADVLLASAVRLSQ